MKDVLSTDIKSSSLRQLPLMSMLYTASDFHLEHDVLQFIDTCIAEKKLKLNPITSNYDKRQKNLKAEQIDLTDDSCGLPSNSTDKLWTVCNGFHLRAKEKQLIEKWWRGL